MRRFFSRLNGRLSLLLLVIAGMFVLHTNPTAKVGGGGRRRTSAHTANYTVTSGESGTIFNNEGAAAEVVFTLPAPADGLWFQFYAAENFNIVVVGDTADNLIVFNDVAADQIAFNTANEIVGGMFNVFSDGAKWMVSEMIHDAQTAVIAT